MHWLPTVNAYTVRIITSTTCTAILYRAQNKQITYTYLPRLLAHYTYIFCIRVLSSSSSQKSLALCMGKPAARWSSKKCLRRRHLRSRAHQARYLLTRHALQGGRQPRRMDPLEKRREEVCKYVCLLWLAQGERRDEVPRSHAGSRISRRRGKSRIRVGFVFAVDDGWSIVKDCSGWLHWEAIGSELEYD